MRSDTASVRDGLPSLNGYRKISFNARTRTSRRFSVHAIAIKNTERSHRVASTFKRENYAPPSVFATNLLSPIPRREQGRWKFQSYKNLGERSAETRISQQGIHRDFGIVVEGYRFVRCTSDRRGSKSAWKPGNCTMTYASNCRLLVY